MSLAGTHFGAYDIVSLLGAGGMGEVYRARDTRLDRDVAIKVLPASFAVDPERLARFAREARLLASLNHPHIAQIYGLEVSPQPFIVMELVEGQTLADRLRGRDSGIGIRDALEIAKQIADALDAAHERGIVHRDLKPANIAITPDGAVKVLDFGLAKSGLSAEAGSAKADGEELTNSPTLMPPTIDGVLLGTAPYMSPEQARGKSVDKRTDIWAYGCVLYEMLTGRRAFGGETATDVLAKIVEREPAWDALPHDTPPSIAHLLRRCLDKDPKRRLRDIGDARADLDRRSEPRSEGARAKWSGALVAGCTLAGILAGIAAARIGRPSLPTPQRRTQFTFRAPEDAQLDVVPPVPSPDGTRIAFLARGADGQNSVWIRAIASAEPQRLAGTEGSENVVFWSPDSASIGFATGGKLKKIAASGGPALNICSVGTLLGATWNRDNTIVLAPANRTVLHTVSASGGSPEPLTTMSVERRENSHRWPQFLPDDRHFLFTARSDVPSNNVIYLGSLDSKTVMPLVAAQSRGVYVAPGDLLYVREQTLMAQRLDSRTFSPMGDPVIVAANVGQNTSSSQAFFGASADGSVIAYEGGVVRRAALTWFDRTGRALGAVGPEQAYQEVRLSPDSRVAAVVIVDADSGNRDISLVNLASGTLSRFTSNPANDWQVAWSPDGKRLAFASDRRGPSSVYVKSVDGGDEELVLKVPGRGAFPRSWSRDGRTLMLDVDTTGGVPSLWAMPLDGDRKPFALTSDDGKARENEATLSADGQWMAFESNQTGVNEIYIVPFPKGGRRQLSNAGGSAPRWKADARELYYVTPTRDVTAVAFTTPGMEAAPPRRLFHACGESAPALSLVDARGWDVTAEGSRFLFVCDPLGSRPSAITVSLDSLSSFK